jgi:hypothetical protein
METPESCWRCGAAMEWRHGTWQCPRCRFKLGCCEGEPQTACERPASRTTTGFRSVLTPTHPGRRSIGGQGAR